MSVRHAGRNRLVPPDGFIELGGQATAVSRPPAAAAGGPVVENADDTMPASAPIAGASGDDERHPVLGGLGVVGVPPDAYMSGALPMARRRHVFLTSTAARIRAYYEAMPEASATRRLVPPSVGQRPSRFDTPVLREALKFALSAGGKGMSEADQKTFLSVLLLSEKGGRAHRRRGQRGAPRPRRVLQLAANAGGVHAEIPPPVDGEGSDEDDGDIARAFRTPHSFLAAGRQEQRRVLSKLCWDVTPLEVEGVAYRFYSRDLLFSVLDMIQNSAHVQLWGEQLGLGSDGTRVRAEIMDSDVFLTEESTVRRRHGSLSFVLGVQLFVDEAVVS